MALVRGTHYPGRMERPDQAVAEAVCECGHCGFLCIDAADREGLSDRWYLVGFKSETIRKKSVRGPIGRPRDFMELLAPECPTCGRHGAVCLNSPTDMDRRFPIVEGWHA